IGHAYALAHRRDEARRLLNELRRSSRLAYVSSYDQAILLMGLGQYDQAIASLQTAVEEHDGKLPIWGNVDPRLDRLSRDPPPPPLRGKNDPAPLVNRYGLPGGKSRSCQPARLHPALQKHGIFPRFAWGLSAEPLISSGFQTVGRCSVWVEERPYVMRGK